MTTRSGSGLLVFGVVMGVAGAIARYAVTATTSGFNIHDAGGILLVVGVVVSVLGVLSLLIAKRSRTTVTQSVHQTRDGEVRTEDRSESAADR